MEADPGESHTSAHADLQDCLDRINTQQDFFQFVEKFSLSYSLPLGWEQHPILPKGLIKRLSEKCIIRKFIASQSLVDEIFLKARTLFVISIYSLIDPSHHETFLSLALTGNITDKELPINDENHREKYTRVFGASLTCRQVAIKDFHRNQNTFCLPVFSKTWHGDFIGEWGMPVHIGEPIGRGAIAAVSEAKIHPDHDEIGKAPSYALKSYLLEIGVVVNGSMRPFDTDSLEQGIKSFQDGYKEIKHDHIVNLLTSWRYKSNWYMVFPLAKSNVSAYMESHENRSGEFVRNLLKQLYGLSAAMAAFHAACPGSDFLSASGSKPPRSGYIRPENILVFEGPEGQGDIFKWADFGCAQFENWGLGAKLLQINRGYANIGTFAYQAPEACEHKECGSKSDIWSMGTVFLEIVVRLLFGRQGLSRLDMDGVKPVIPLVPLTLRFFKNEDGIVLRQEVASMLGEIEEHLKCKGQLRVLRDAIAKMLTIDPEQRPSSEDVKNMLSALDNVGDHDFDDGWAPEETEIEPERDVSGISIVVTSSDP